jgi:hypothetical protein
MIVIIAFTNILNIVATPPGTPPPTASFTSNLSSTTGKSSEKPSLTAVSNSINIIRCI